MPKMSLIIPVYNVEKYLSKCLDSCIAQTLTDIEIICIEDCSTDNSLKILYEYEKKDSRIIIIRQEKNSGSSANRNLGLKKATGEYVWFIDSDDYIDINACQYFYTNCKTNNLDILRFCANVFFEEEDREVFIDSDYFPKWPLNKIIDMKTQQNYLPIDFGVSPCHYITKLSLIKKFSFEIGRFYEDTDFTPILFSNSNKLKCVNFCGYYRRITPGSITQTPYTTKKILDRLDITNRLNKYIRINKLNKKSYLYKFMHSHAIWTEHNILKPNINLLSKNESEYKEFVSIISKLKGINNISFKIKSKITQIFRKF